MLPLQPNPETGFLESKGIHYTFDSNRKKQFLELAASSLAQGVWPNISEIGKMIGIAYSTFATHVQVDPVFKAAWEEVKMSAASVLESKMFEYGQEKGGYMDRITWLRKNVPHQWNPEYKLQINSDSGGLKGVIDAIPAEIVEDVKPQEQISAPVPLIPPSELPK